MLTADGLHASKDLVRRGDIGEEHAVAQAVERRPQRREAFRGGVENGSDPELVGEPVPRGKIVAVPPQFIVIGEIRPTGARAPRRDVVREQAREPQAVVPELRLQQECAFAGFVVPRQIRDDVHQVMVGLVVGPPHPGMPVVVAELEQQYREIVGEIPVVYVSGKQGVTHGDVREQRRRGHHEGAYGDQRREQRGVVEQPVGALFEQQTFAARTPRRIPTREREDDKPKIRSPQATAQVR